MIKYLCSARVCVRQVHVDHPNIKMMLTIYGVLIILRFIPKNMATFNNASCFSLCLPVVFMCVAVDHAYFKCIF